MNIYAIVILAALLIHFVLGLVADLLNLRELKRPLPAEFEDVYDTDKYRKAQDYTLARTRFGMAGSFFSLIVLLLFWFLGGFNGLDQWIRSYEWPFLVNGLFFIGVIVLAQSLLSLPFSIYSTFVIEERFGFNKTTAKTFAADRLKGLFLTVILGVPILIAILAVFQFAGTAAWLYVWAIVVLYGLFVQFIAPTWIMPLFNTFTPLPEGELREAIMNYAGKINFPVREIFSMDGSRRSGKSNAFFAGFGKNKRIALFDTLIDQHKVNELLAVVAHEVGHYKKKHIPKNLIIGFMQTGVMLFLLSLFLRLPGLHEAFFMQEISVYAGLLFFGLLYTPVDLILSMGLQSLSRKFEFEADRYAVETTGNAGAMVDALKKLSADNLSHLTPHPFYVFLHYSHPPVLQRIEAIRKIDKEMSSASVSASESDH